MKLSELTAEPKLIEIVIDDEHIVAEYNDVITFHTWDRQPMDIFTRLANLTDTNDISGLIEIVRTLVLDENGNKIIDDKSTLPTKILMAVIGRITEQLGK